MDDEMIERCANAMVKAMQRLPPGNANAKLVVIDTIKAMREPTKKMLLAGKDDSLMNEYRIYQAMIDAVINEQS